MSILVTGGTGKIGQFLLETLAAKKVSATVLTRDPAKVVTNAHIKAVKGDISDAASFALAVRGHERLFLLTNRQDLEVGLAKAAKDAGVKHIVRISCWLANAGHDQGSIFQAHGRVEVELENLGVAVTTLRLADFMQNLLGSAASIKHGVFHHNLTPTTRVASIDALDIAKSAAAVLTSPIEQHAGLAYTLTGPEAITKDELAKHLSSVAGKEVKAIQVSDVAYAQALASFGIPARFAFLLANLGQHYNLSLQQPSGFVVHNVEYLTGEKPRTWTQFLEENKKAFQ